MRFKRFSAMLLALAMCMGVFSTTVFAYSDESATNTTTEKAETVETVPEKTEDKTSEELPYTVTVNEDGTVVFSFNGKEWTYGAEESEDNNMGTGKVVTSGSRLNVRTGAGMNYEIIDQLRPGEEVVVVGVEGDWYQITVPEKNGYVHSDYLELIEKAAEVPGIERIRLGSLDPDMLHDDDIRRMAAVKKLCPQFHLSLQSGCDATLRRMNRHYDTAGYRAVAEAVRKAFPGAALTTDMMVGFAGETEADHLESLAFAREIGFAKIHAFAYSQRPGTRAAAMPDQVPQAEKKRRCAELISVAAGLRKTALAAMLGQVQPVLFESRGQQGCTGYTPNYTPVTVCDPAARPGDIRPVLLTAISPDADGCEGIIVE